MAAVIRTISYNDDQLVIMINNKNQKAFAQLYDKYAAALYGSIYRQVENKKIAEDILQQTFFKVWASLTDHIVLKNHLFMWMLNVARNITEEKTASSDNHISNLQLATS